MKEIGIVIGLVCVSMGLTAVISPALSLREQIKKSDEIDDEFFSEFFEQVKSSQAQ